jgi:hypothetical protein
MSMNISDLEGTMYQSKTLRAKTNFSIEGMPDPLIHRNDMIRRGVSYDIAAGRQIFKHASYQQPSDVRPRNIKNGTRGFGWFYGGIRESYPDPNLNEPLSQLILVKRWDENLSYYAPLYGAVIVTNLPAHVYSNYTDPSSGCTYRNDTETQCLNCVTTFTLLSGTNCPVKNPVVTQNTSNPYMAVDGSAWLNQSNLKPIKRTGMTPQEEQFVLMDNKRRTWDDSEPASEDYHYIWDMNSIRDMSICGFYVKSPLAPSFFQRMLASPSGTINSPLGIETFLVGKWAGGSENTGYEDYPKLDWRFYSAGSGYTDDNTPKIKGMMGCKSLGMCSGTNATSTGVGFFRLGNDDVSRYGLNLTACNVDRRTPRMAPCS